MSTAEKINEARSKENGASYSLGRILEQMENQALLNVKMEIEARGCITSKENSNYETGQKHITH